MTKADSNGHYISTKNNDGMGGGKRVSGKAVLPCSLERRIFSEQQQQAQQESADKKMQVKTTGDLKTKWGLSNGGQLRIFAFC